MAIRVTLECGHASMLRVRTTPQGYTHDWEVFVRGVDNADISQYVDKVVYHLHETFPKPKRILKESPYVVKESGYAGFVIPIEIYLKNKDEPKRIQISYDLILQPTGPAFNNVIRHNELFVNPSEEFRKKLLKGGGIAVSSSEDQADKGEFKMVPPMVSKPKLSGTEVKKHRMTDLRTSNSFADLFGNPMTLPAKVSPDNNKRPGGGGGGSGGGQPSDKVISTKGLPEKTDKLEKPTKIKHSPHKEKKKEKSSADDRKEKREKILAKDKERIKEKSKRPPSPVNKEEFSYGTVKKTMTATTTTTTTITTQQQQQQQSPTKKQLVTPASSVAQKSPSPKPKERDHKRMHNDKDKDRLKDNFKIPIEDRKLDRKKKKHKDDRSKERKDKDKDREHEKTRETSKRADRKIGKSEKHEKTDKDRSGNVNSSSGIVTDIKVSKDDRKSPKHTKERDKARNDKNDRNETTERTTKDSRSDKDKQKHKHRRKDKKDRTDESLDKEKQEKLKVTSDKRVLYTGGSPSLNPLSTLLAEMPERDSSDSAHSAEDDNNVPIVKTFLTSRNTDNNETNMSSITRDETSKAVSPRDSGVDATNIIEERSKRDKTRAGRGEERDCRKRKRKVEGNGHEEEQEEEEEQQQQKQLQHAVKRSKEREESISPSVEPVSSSQSPISIDIDPKYNFKEATSSNTRINDNKTEMTEQVAPDSTNGTLAEQDNDSNQVFSDDYVTQLKELQQKIMTLQDNQELQRVVQVIAETGQYEITRKTFDFDLCALDRRTVLRLQQFFSTS